MSTEDQSNQWHAVDIDAVVKQLETDAEQGLSAQEADNRLRKYGPNRLPEEEKRGPLARFFAQFHSVLIYLLLAASVLAALLNEWIEAAVILGVVLINVVVSFIQEGRAERALQSIKKMLSHEATCIRDSTRETVRAENLVPGDLVQLKSGDKVPADLRLVRVKNLRVEESALTGESEEVGKSVEPTASDASLGDQRSMAFSGTTVNYGEASGVVVATGQDTQIGHINRMMSEVEDEKTPLLRTMDRFGRTLAVAIVLMAGVFFAFGILVQGYELDEMFLTAIAIVVASIPEGLPAILTVILALGVQRMARRNAIIRRLPSVETLGSVKVICSDKTGTLTRNEMTAQSVVTESATYQAEGSGYEPEGKIHKDGDPVALDDDPVLSTLLQCARACNDASIAPDDESGWKLRGTPTEGALMTLAYKAGLEEFSPRRIDSIPFESEHKYMATLNETDDGRIIYLKGAPESVLDRCDRQLTDAGPRSIDVDFWKNQMDEIAGRGERIIACALREEAEETEAIEHDTLGDAFVFLGLVGIIDPPRQEVLEAIEECNDAGIRVIMVTGDHVITAGAVARQLGIGEEQEPVEGTRLAEMDDAELRETVKTHSVFARTNPEHKLRLVKALREQKTLCAMTGDGVNDAPALKSADIGIAMGIKGTEVTKEAADMVLADDNFASIVHAVEEGRTIYDNLKKTILFLLPANGAEASVIIAAILLGLTLPISPVQILWVNMVSAVTLALAFTVEPMERQVMKHPPREQDEPILDREFVWRVAFVSLLSGGLTLTAFYLNYDTGMDADGLAQARTVAVNMLVVAHTCYFITCRKLYESSLSKAIFSNPMSFLLIGVLVLLQLAFTYIPVMNVLFGTAPVRLGVWPLLLAAGAGVLIVVEVEKLIGRRWLKRRSKKLRA